MPFREDLRTYREGLLAQGFWALQIYRFGHARYAFKSKLIRVPWGLVHLVLNKFSEIFFGIYIGVTAKIGRRFRIEHFGSIIIHGATVIGDDVIVRQNVTIGNQRLDDPQGAPTIGSRVNIGAGAKILGRITIGDDVDVGANAVVVTDVPSRAIVVGVPGRIKLKAPQEGPS